MAFVFRSIPMMVRLSLAGGTAYGTAKVGVWSDSTDSQDKLKEARKSLYEIEYPAAVSNHLHPASPEPSVSKGTLSSITLSAAKTWNSAIKSVCQSAVLRANSSDNLHLSRSVDKLTRQLKKWTDK